jgi:GT2 family glycosyltransferase
MWHEWRPLRQALQRRRRTIVCREELRRRMTNTDYAEPWRRWFDGPARVHEGAQVAAADLAVVVIGFMAREDLAAAVASLRAQFRVEIVVVNSGGGPVREKLAAHLDHIRLVEVEAPLFVGASRNIGIDCSRAPYVSFLAGDCTAAPGWVATRLAAHRAGARAVASAVAPPTGANDWTRAAHLCLFGSRSPRVPAAMAQRYGASYERQVYAEFGYFNPALRIAEDSDLAQRLAGEITAEWNPGVVTIHPGPASAGAFAADMYARGRRAARFQPHRGNPILASARYVLGRANTASRMARDVWKMPAVERLAMQPAIWSGALVYGVGVWRGLLALRRARTRLALSRTALAQGDLAAATAHAEQAVTGNGEDVSTLLHLADLMRHDTAQTRRFTAVLRRAQWLSTFDSRQQRVLCSWLLERDMAGEMRAFAARLGMPRHALAPGSSAVHADVPRSAAWLLDVIGLIEAPRGYGSIFRNRQNRLEKPLTAMTLAEVLAAQPGWDKANGSGAAGRYQVIEPTLAGVIAELGLDPGDRFAPSLQDRIGYHLLRRRGFDQFAAGMLPLADFALALAQEWAGFPVLTAMPGAHRRVEPGETFYAGDGRNQALIWPAAFIAILRQSLALAQAEAPRILGHIGPDRIAEPVGHILDRRVDRRHHVRFVGGREGVVHHRAQRRVEIGAIVVWHLRRRRSAHGVGGEGGVAHRAGLDHTNAHALRLKLVVQRFRHALERVLGCHVVRQQRRRHEADARSDVDDDAPARLQRRDGGADDVQRPEIVRLEHAPHVRIARWLEQRQEADAGIVHHRVEPAEAGHRRLHGRRDADRVGNVEGLDQHFGMLCRQRRIRLPHCRGDVPALAGEVQRRIAAESARSPGDQNCLAHGETSIRFAARDRNLRRFDL